LHRDYVKIGDHGFIIVKNSIKLQELLHGTLTLMALPGKGIYPGFEKFIGDKGEVSP
jgi:hypothetical protein